MIEQLLSNLNYDSPEGPPGVEFLGEVATANFIDGEELASEIGLTAGTAQHSDSPWLHFVLDGVELYVAKKPYRHSVSWNQINDVGAVFGDSRVEINGRIYKVRLPKSVANGDEYTGTNDGYDPEGAYQSEWNRLMYSVHSGNHIHTGVPTPVSGEGLYFGTLAQYTDADLVLNYGVGNGSYNWCQETPSSSPTNRVTRGYISVSYLRWGTTSSVTSSRGWRPVLELVE